MVVAWVIVRYSFLSLQTHYVKVLSVHHNLHCRSSSAVVLRNTLVRKVQHLKCRIQMLFLHSQVHVECELAWLRGRSMCTYRVGSVFQIVCVCNVIQKFVCVCVSGPRVGRGQHSLGRCGRGWNITGLSGIHPGIWLLGLTSS